jgi:Ni/Fe-hydrogenase 1 B-type cytochrome subunit
MTTISDQQASMTDSNPIPTSLALPDSPGNQTTTKSFSSVYIYEAPVRVWHWVNALSILTLAITGYLIGSPLWTVQGEPSQHFIMGYIRFVHFSAGYILAIGLVGRVYWAIVGNYYAKELFSVPIFEKAFWIDIWGMVLWYTFAAQRPARYLGHNPLARLAMATLFLWTAIFQVFTGFAMYSQGEQLDTWSDYMFGWVIPLLGQSQDVHDLHHLGMWLMVIFVMAHVYTAIREEILGRSSMVSTMISGWRTFKD